MTITDSIKERLLHLAQEPPDRIYGLRGCAVPLYLSLFPGRFLLIAGNEDGCLRLVEDYRFHAGLCGAGGELIHFPDSDDIASSGRQVELMVKASGTASLAATLTTCQKPLNMPQELISQTLSLRKGEVVSREDLVEFLLEFGYRKTAMVVEKGEFSARSYIVDLYPVSLADPVRIEFFGDEIDSLRVFSVDSQRTLKHLEELVLLPLKQTGGTKLLPELFPFDRIFCLEEATGKGREQAAFLTGSVPVTLLSTGPIDSGGLSCGALPITGLGIRPQERTSLSSMALAIGELSQANQVMIVSATTAQAQRMRDIFVEADREAPVINREDAPACQSRLFITTGSLSEGVFLDGLLILTETELFGEMKRQRHLKTRNYADVALTMDDLKTGDYVVHEDHGIGVFEGLKHECTEGFEADMLIIRYEDAARLYLPVYGIGGIKKYRAQEGILPHLDKLGGKTWQKVKAKVRSKIKIAAEKLVKHYAEREVTQGFAVTPDGALHREFDNFFPYEETPDQLTAIKEIKRDMELDRPMDRLLCGDVGYGKTEVAMRAAFKAVHDGKQVAVLVPTTILCEQHYINFKERFSAFAAVIDSISRFKTKKKVDETLQRLAKGEVDIIIGTHGLLRKGLDIPALGLLIIDEEHRFGVAQKERIKELKRGVHCLSMSATPIPRTLQMALSGIWTMSTIETPPEDRQAVRTFLSTYNTQVMKEAIERELAREGQVFVVHNRIRDIDKLTARIKELVPQATVATAHGRMKETELEDIVIDFMKGEIQILVSTAIIGSGIDIPRANTIIVNRADMMGLADLYQLRGRVGRSNLRAYAHFFIPGEEVITETARQRLAAISDLSYLGAGLQLAMRDMEIRGAGNLLGAEQSGHIHAVGLDTYMEMLEAEVAQLKGCPVTPEVEPTIDLHLTAFIPEEYVEDVTLRLSFYRRITLARQEEDLFALEDEMTDRFGRLPEGAVSFFDALRLKILCKRLKLLSVTLVKDKVQVIQSPESPVLAVLREEPAAMQKRSRMKLRFLQDGFEVFRKDLPVNPLKALIELFKGIEDAVGKERKEGSGVGQGM